MTCLENPACWTCWRGSLSELHQLKSLSYTSSCLLHFNPHRPAVLVFSHSLQFLASIDFALNSENLVPIRVLCQAKLSWPDTLEKTSDLFYILHISLFVLVLCSYLWTSAFFVFVTKQSNCNVLFTKETRHHQCQGRRGICHCKSPNVRKLRTEPSPPRTGFSLTACLETKEVLHC